MLEWQERFAIGVESIDNAHRELFRIINKLHKLAQSDHSNIKWTASQTIRYVQSYTLKHFQDEEAYMVSINFRDYEAHKAIHTSMREKIIPRLYSYLEQENYSPKSIELFLNVLEKWLTKHIVGQDRELIQKALEQPVKEKIGVGSQDQGEETRAMHLSGISGEEAEETSPSPVRRTRRMKSVFLLAVTLVVFGVAYAVGGLLVKSRLDKLAELKASSRDAESALAELRVARMAEETALTRLRAARTAEEAAFAELRSETWGIRLMILPDGTKKIILPKGMKYEGHEKIEEGEYTNFEGIIVK